MKKRQLKKLNNKAMHLLIEMNYCKPDDFSVEGGELVRWYQNGGMEPEWDCEPVYRLLRSLVFDQLLEFSEDGQDYKQRTRLKGAKHVFHLARQMIERGVV